MPPSTRSRFLKFVVHAALIAVWLSASLIASLTDFGRRPAPVLAAGPAASVSVALPATVLIGSSFSFTVTFANTSGVPTDVGYGPFVDLLFPYNGADGAAGTDTPDGLNFASAAYLGQPVESVVLTIPDADGAGPGTTGAVNHPYAVDTANRPITVTATAGDKLVVLRLPFGSFVPGQTPVDMTVNASLSNLADLGAPLTLRYRGGYMFGATPLNDWCCDPVILSSPGSNSGTWPGSATTPNLFALTKANPMAENETATGPNFPHPYNIGVDIPAGQVVTGLRITDTLPSNAAYLTGTVTATPGGYSLLDEPLAPGAQNPPDNDLVVSWPITLTGAAGTDATTDFSFFIPFTDAVGAPIVNPLTGACATSTNSAASSVDWIPVDPRDGPTPITATATAPAVSACALVGQKGMSVVTDTGALGPTPGDTVRVTINFQVSDFFAFGGVVITDTLGDGLHFRSATTPTLLVNGNSFTLAAAAMNAANFSVIDHWTGAPSPVPPITGTTDVVFRISDELVTRGQPTGRLLGGCVPTGGAATPDCASYNDGPTTGQIVFEAVIQDQFTDNFPSGDASVDHGDNLPNNLLVAGAVLTTTAGFAPTGFTAANASSASLSVAFGSLTKTIYAIGGNTAYTTTQVSPGVTVTYRIQYTMPASDFESTQFTDYLPLPIFAATEVTTYTTPITGSAVPPAGRFKFGPADTVYTTFGLVPTLTVNSTANTLSFDYGTYDDPLNRDTTIDLLYTVAASNQPFADKLFLTNQVHTSEGTTNAGSQTANAIMQVQLTEPALRFGKAAVATDRPGAVFAPATAGPVTFNAPGTAGPRWSGVINSTNLAASPINSNVSGVDAGDRVTFALVVENVGSSPNGAFDIAITDTLPSGFVIPAGGLNLRASFGDSAMAAISYVGLGGGPDGLPNTPDDLFGSGIQLVDNPTSGICQAHHLTNGLNVIIITYDLEVANTVAPSQPIVNSGGLTGYGGTEGGPNHLSTPLTDTATITVSSVGLGKTIVGTNQPHTTGNTAAIGEIITYTLAVTVPEGVTSNGAGGVTIVDTLDSGLAFVDCLGLSASPALSTDLAGGFPAACNDPANPTVNGVGRVITFTLGNLTNPDTNNAITETINLTYTVAVLNSTGNNRGVGRNNSATLSWNNGAPRSVTASAPNVTLREPTLVVDKTVTPAGADAGDVITFSLRLSNTAPSNTTAFEVVLTDVVPSGLTYVPGSLANVSGVAAALDDSAAPALTATWTSLALNQNSLLQFRATVNATAVPGDVITNTANARWTSLPGDVTTTQTPYSPLGVERTGDTANPGGAENDHRASDPAGVSIAGTGFVKALESTSAAHTAGGSVAIGEVITYALTVTLPEGVTPSLVVTDALPSGLAFVPGSASINTTGFNGAVNAADPVVTSAGGNGDDVVFTFNNAIPVAVNNDPADNSFVLRLSARVLNAAGNQNAVALVNSATLRAGAATATTNPITTTVVEPALQAAKTVDDATPMFGQTLTFTLTVSHAPASAADAFDLLITDTLPAGMTLVPGSAAAAPSGTITESAPTLVVAIPSLVSGATSTITYRAVVGAPNPPTHTVGTSLTNTVSAAWTSLPGGDTGERTGSGGDDDYGATTTRTVTVTGPDLRLSKTDGGVTAVPGGLITYTLTITNAGNGDATGVLVTDTVPANTFFVGASNGGSESGGLATWPAFSLAGGASVTRTLAVRVSNPLPAGVTSVTNTARVGDDGTNGADPNPGDNSGGDAAPVSAFVDLRLGKSAGAASAAPGGALTFTLAYTNVGNIAATGVRITETVPANTTFSAAASAPFVWSCADGSPAGTTCVLVVGAVAGGGGGSAQFAVRVDSPLPSGVSTIANTALVGDDGASGADPTPPDNTGGASLPISAPTAVTLLYFRIVGVVSNHDGAQVTLGWETAAEIDNFGFAVYRASANDFAQAQAVAFVPSAIAGGTGAGASYAHTDAAPSSGPWWYWLVDVDTHGVETPHGPATTALAPGGQYVLYLPVIVR
jgi:uncharacterized repeat protein (TIGR01451 family)/fimbrial isopeptide formation D2 family protein